MAGTLMRVLVLGSGFTSGPLVEYLTRDGRIAVTVASNIVDQAQQLASKFQNTQAVALDVHSESNLSQLVSSHDLTVSYVPYVLHPLVAKQCVTHRKSLVTSSYVSPQLQEFHQPAKDAGITLLNEVGLDPGIDHMLAMECFDEVRNNGGKVISFESWCGGLPHPDCANNPLKYKFSWSPRSVFLAALNQAKYKKDKNVNEIAEGELMIPANIQSFSTLNPGIKFEGYFNRDSLKYIDIYGIHEAQTVIRGTLRYKGTCRILQAMYKLGLLDLKENQRLTRDAASMRWRDLMAILISQTDIRESDICSSVFEAVGRDDQTLGAFEQLGLLSDEPVDLVGSPLNALCTHLERQLTYGSGERDAIFLHHLIGIEWPDKQVETRHIDLTMYGAPYGFSAMAQTVGKPAAIAAKMILNGDIKRHGVVTPTTADIYAPILDALKGEGIEATVKIQKEKSNEHTGR